MDILRALVLAATLLSAAVCNAEALTPDGWLQRMAVAVQSVNYEGTVVRVQSGKTEALKVARDVSDDGVIREKIVAQEGNGLEIIRIGSEVHCILPDRKSVLVEEWNDQSALFSTLPSSKIRFGNEYDLSVVREGRVAGRDAVLLAIRPHDRFRYGQRIWLDVETAFPLHTQLIAADGSAIEQVKFADIALNQEIHASALAPSYSTEDFRWFRQPSRHANSDVDTEWTCENLPRGFRALSTHEETMSESGELVTHILYSDGLANVSVFIAALDDNDTHGPSQMGASSSFSAITTDHHITAVGEVPPVTVEQIATSMRRR
ncbi:MAG: MucB/RseB C-terminal domain-containing protein [Gammaproteobacteria bacterium]|nr:MucB/RseB C-terminal domain-containing protein [Gammaproteobacteria bacterium]